MYGCMYVCLHVCMHVCMNVCLYVCMYVCVYVFLHVCMSVCMHVCVVKDRGAHLYNWHEALLLTDGSVSCEQIGCLTHRQGGRADGRNLYDGPPLGKTSSLTSRKRAVEWEGLESTLWRGVRNRAGGGDGDCVGGAGDTVLFFVFFWGFMHIRLIVEF